MKGDGKPPTLLGLREKAQNIDARYWERQQERTREQRYQSQRPQQSSKPSTSSSNTPSSTSKNPNPKTQSQTTEQKPPKPKDNKSDTPRVDLTGKLDSRGRLTQQERQYRLDKNLCLYCGEFGHRTPDCKLSKNASSAKGRATATSSSETPPKPKSSGSEKKKE
jgi:hypothetical protein